MAATDLYLEDWSDLGNDLAVEPMPAYLGAGTSTASSVSTISTASCPLSSVNCATTVSSAS